MNWFPKPRINDDDDDVDDVAEYFKQIDQCEKLPDAILFKESDEIQKLNLKEGKQIRIFKENDTNGNIDPDIYVITSITREPNTKLITNVGIESTVDNNVTKNIELNAIYNIVNINPQSFHINDDFLERIITTDTQNLTLVTQLKYELHKATIAFIRQKQFDSKDVLEAFQEETFNIANANAKILDLKNEILNLPNTKNNTIYTLIERLKASALDPIKRTTACYYIQYLNTVLEYSGIDPNSKDYILNNYIFLCECLSATVIAGAIQFGFTRRTWIFNILYIFLETILNIPLMNTYIITPAITLYLYTNMDTIYLSTNYLINGINELLSIILCSITTAIDAIPKNINPGNDNDDNESVASSKSNITFATASSRETIITVSTFPSLLSIKSLYNSQKVNDINDDDEEKTYGKALTDDLEIITQGDSVLGSSQSTWNTDASEYSQRGGKNKRSRLTKKQKRITIRGSKKSKKMKGGKRTRTTKKRRIVRRKKHNTKKR
jgi:hypothetical protein